MNAITTTATDDQCHHDIAPHRVTDGHDELGERRQRPAFTQTGETLP